MKYVENGIRLRCLQPGKCVDVEKMAADVVVVVQLVVVVELYFRLKTCRMRVHTRSGP